MKNFINIEWFKDNLNNENLIVFDVRSVLGNENYGMEEYNKGHIPNAIFIPVEEVLTGEIKEHGGRHPLPDMKKFADDINKLGVDDESTVIIYDGGDLSMAGRLWWMLKYIGFKKAYVLLGGFNAWKSSTYPLSTDLPSIRKSKNLTLNLQKNMIADMEDAKKAALDKTQVLIDSRTADRYRGEVEPIDKVPGHIPGAVNIPWTDIPSYEKINESIAKEHYKSVSNYDKIVIHCGSGITATVNIMFMEEADLHPAMYVGGYSDWISYPENEIATEI